MSTEVIVALIAGVCSIVGAFVGQSISAAKSTSAVINAVKNASDVTDAEIKGDIAVIKTEIVDLKDEVRKHNGVIERMYKAERDIAVNTEQIKVANHRIEDLERAAAK